MTRKIFKGVRGLSGSRNSSQAVLTSGPQGVDHRGPSLFSDFPTNGVVVTDPYVVYKALVNLGKLFKDESQLRVMKELQKLYHRLVDYRPSEETEIKTSVLLRKLELLRAEEQNQNSARSVAFHPLRSWLRRDVEAKKREMIKYLTDEEELRDVPSPQGLLVNGEVGCGKSMLMNIFAESLPHHSKMRWHYNSFILWVFGEIHKIQKQNMLTASVRGKHSLKMENEFILFEIAQKMIMRSTVFMLDEFMLPDVAAAQIIRILFTYYFKLGGVLVATSNKLPEELYLSGFNKSRFSSFVGILNSRCIAVDMNSTMDYRKELALKSTSTKNMVVKGSADHHEQWARLIGEKVFAMSPKTPNFAEQLEKLPWEKAEITVYNRTSLLPKTLGQICWLDFSYICQGLFSSSDYITIALKFSIVIVDNVPAMNLKMKNEARRFITFLDALYEARCQLYLRTDVDLDKLFFHKDVKAQVDSELVQQEEMYAKTTMQTLNPYRPNVSSYDSSHAKTYDDSGLSTNYSNVKAFTGEDERFAYKRAASRIQEMVGSDDWNRSLAWIPLHNSMRPWEEVSAKSATKKPLGLASGENTPSATETDLGAEMTKLGPMELKAIKTGLQSMAARDLSAVHGDNFRDFNAKISPAFSSLLHFWGLGEWTLEQQRKVKDKIARSWVGGSLWNKQ